MDEITNEIVPDEQIFDEWFQDYLSDLKKANRTEIKRIEREQSPHDPKDLEKCAKLKQIDSAATKLNRADQRKKAVKKVLDKLGDKANRDETEYYSAGAQELINILYFTAAEEELKDTSLLPSVRTYKPSDLNIPSAKVVSRIFSNDLDTRKLLKKGNCETEICKSIRGKPCKRKVTEIKCVQLVNEKELLSNLTTFDKNVFYGICSIYEKCAENGQTTNIVMTAGQIYTAFTGSETKHTSTLNKVAAAVEKLSCYRISFNWLEHAQLNGLASKDIPDKQKRRYIVTDNLIHVKTVSCIVNGKAVDHAFKLMEIPALYEYAKKVRQIVSVQQEVLKIPELSNTDDIIAIKTYLAYRIELMKNTRNRVKSDKILFDTVFEECQIKFRSNEVVERKRKRDTICKILDYWVTTNYIAWYELTKENSKFVGIQITL